MRKAALKLFGLGCAILLASLFAFAEEHKWAGRTLNDLEWRIHEELAMVPFYGVFDTVRFELRDKTVTLSGQVLRESVNVNAERVVKRLDGVENVVNQIEVLPSSRRDDAIRMNVYRAIYEKEPLEQYGTRAVPPDSHHRERHLRDTGRCSGFGSRSQRSVCSSMEGSSPRH